MVGVALPHAAPGDGICVTSLCARSRGEPSSAHCEQRLSERLTPRPCEPVCACTGMRGHAGKGKSGSKAGKTMQPRSQRNRAFLSAYPHAAQRAVTGWRGGLGRVGADLASAGSMRPPPSPARHVSTAWLATTHASRETARNHTRQPRSSTPPPKPAKQRQYIATRHHTSQARSGKPPQEPTEKRQPQNTCLIKMRIAGKKQQRTAPPARHPKIAGFGGLVHGPAPHRTDTGVN